MHELGIVHHDLHDQNIMVNSPIGDGEPEIKIIDFGIASFERGYKDSMGIHDDEDMVKKPSFKRYIAKLTKKDYDDVFGKTM